MSEAGREVLWPTTLEVVRSMGFNQSKIALAILQILRRYASYENLGSWLFGAEASEVRSLFDG